MIKFPSYMIYLIYTAVLGVILICLVPRKDIKEFLIYGMIFGGVYDVFWILVIMVLRVGGYKNFGPFGFLGIPFFPPIAWSIYFIMFFYFLPKKGLVVPYFFAIAATFYAIFFSNVLHNLNIFQWIKSSFALPLLLYGIWHVSATWAFLKLRGQA